MADPQKSAIDSYLKELAELVNKRFELQRRISRLEEVVSGMIDLIDNEEQQIGYMDKLYDVMSPTSLTSAIEQVLKSEDRGFTPMEVREKVKDHLNRHSNPMASVHTILKRLVKTEWVEVFTKDDKTYYRFVDLPEQYAQDAQKMAGIVPRNRGRFASRFTSKFTSPRARNRAFYGEMDPAKLPDEVRRVVDQTKKK